MQPTLPDPRDSGPLPLQRRLWGRWWRRQSPARQDRFATLGPLASVLLFLAAIIAAFWYLRNEEIEREAEAVKRDTEIAQQQIRLRLIENQEQLVRMARELVSRELDANDFSIQAATFINDRPEITQFSWLAADRHARARRLQPLGLLRQPVLAQRGNVVPRRHGHAAVAAGGARGSAGG